jgi:hypothetical protein
MYFKNFAPRLTTEDAFRKDAIEGAEDICLFLLHGFSQPVVNDSFSRRFEASVNGWPTLGEAALYRLQFWLRRVEGQLAQIIDEPDSATVRERDYLAALADQLLAVENDEIVSLQPLKDLPFNVFLDAGSPMAVTMAADMFDAASPALLSSDAGHYWQQTVLHALKLIERFAPESMQPVSQTLKLIVPVHSHRQDQTLSGTPDGCIGILAASWVPAKNFAETIIHECAHSALNNILRTTPMVGANKKNYYSPFRSDPRPAIGLLHAQYSFHNVCLFLSAMQQDDGRLGDWAESMLGSYLFNTYLCGENLLHGDELTQAGRKLVAAMNDDVLAIRAAQHNAIPAGIAEQKKTGFEAWQQNAVIGPQALSAHKALFGACYNLFFDASPAASLSPAPGQKARLLRKKDFEGFGQNAGDWQSPILFRSIALIDSDILAAELVKLGGEEITMIDAETYTGHRNTPRTQTKLANWMDEMDAGAANKFVIIRNFDRKLGDDILKPNNFWDRFFLDSGELWLFANAKGLEVLLHQDSVHNVHFVISGRKRFFIAPSHFTFDTPDSRGRGFRDGFSEFSPFINEAQAEQCGVFVDVSAGETLFIPKDWWHAVSYSEDSIAVAVIDELSENKSVLPN